MGTIVAAIAHTPFWVFPVIAFVLGMGARHLRARTLSPRTLFVMPLIIAAASIANAATTDLDAAHAFAAWIPSAALGLVIGWTLAPRPLGIDRQEGQIFIAGSAQPLLIIVALVMLRYTFGYLYGRWPELHGNPTYAAELVAGGALLAGVTAGRYGRFGWWYRRSA